MLQGLELRGCNIKGNFRLLTSTKLPFCENIPWCLDKK